MALLERVKFRMLLMVILLIQVPSEGDGDPRVNFLNKVLYFVRNERSVETLFLLHHTEDTNCILKDWNPMGVPTLRSNELTDLSLENSYNHNALALVCVTEHFHGELLKTLARAFEGMRQERIILLIRRKPDPDLMHHISQQVKDLEFLHMIVLIVEKQDYNDVIAFALRLKPFPEPHFKKVRNLFTGKNIFPHYASFQGRVASIIPNEVQSVYRAGSQIILEFARKYNASLRLQGSATQDKTEIPKDNYDIDMNLRLSNSKNFSNNIFLVATLSSSSLLIVVPCGMELSGVDIFKELGMGTLTWSALIFYLTFALVEATFVYISNRINGTHFSIRFTNPFVNLRAFRALLGHAFPVSNRSSPSIQLFLCLMSFFGTLFGCFFACKLSSFLTKKPHDSQIETFSELRESGLTIVVDASTKEFIELEINGDFFNHEVPNVRITSSLEFIKLIDSLEMNAGFLVHSIPWTFFKEVMKELNRKVYCEGKNLTIIENVPSTFFLQRNTIFSQKMRDFILNTDVSGLGTYWMKLAGQQIKASIKASIKSSMRGFEEHPSHLPLSFDHFKWLWTLLGIAYIISFMVFVMEICWAKSHKRMRRGNIYPC
ncbi:uncharacterized protein [Drosophila takahashii]|uniref:uncharacterized protein n=1 Tax=Drosophila takahashii TaxID=29030 RepID=UPI001CF85C9D|nr:uncharacterized protein LOC108064355 [Drosophila takahashii]